MICSIKFMLSGSEQDVKRLHDEQRENSAIREFVDAIDRAAYTTQQSKLQISSTGIFVS